jgi:hypothetical protein
MGVFQLFGMERAMKTLALALAFGALVASCASARAERFDCSAFRGAQAQFACYENLSRAPESKETLKANAAKPRTAAPPQRKLRAD